MKYLRLVAYILLVASIFIVWQGKRTVPVRLTNSIDEANEQARASNRGLYKEADLLHCTKSGKEVSAIARSVLAQHIKLAEVAETPEVKLKKEEEGIYWILKYRVSDPPPGSSYSISVEIDDMTGKARLLSP